MTWRGRPNQASTTRKSMDTDLAPHKSPPRKRESGGSTQWKPSGVPKSALGSILPPEMKDAGVSDFLKNNILRTSSSLDQTQQSRRTSTTRPVSFDFKRHRETEDELYARRAR